MAWQVMPKQGAQDAYDNGKASAIYKVLYDTAYSVQNRSPEFLTITKSASDCRQGMLHSRRMQTHVDYIRFSSYPVSHPVVLNKAKPAVIPRQKPVEAIQLTATACNGALDNLRAVARLGKQAHDDTIGNGCTAYCITVVIVQDQYARVIRIRQCC